MTAVLLVLSLGQNEDLIRRLQDQNPKVRATVADLLGLYKDPKAIPALIPLLDDGYADPKEAAYKSLRTITGKTDLPKELGPWREWWEKEGRAKYGAALGVSEEQLKRLDDRLRELEGRVAGMDLKNLKEELGNLRTEVSSQLNSTTLLMLIVGTIFVLIMIYFVGHISSRIKEWKDLMRQGDTFLKEGQAVIDRVDKIISEVDQKKAELPELFKKMRDDTEEEVGRHADMLQQNTEHRMREAMMELRQKAEKELEATVAELQGQMDHEMRKLANGHREKILKDADGITKKFLEEVEVNRVFLQAEFYASHGRYEEAIREYKRVLAIRPDWQAAWMNMGTTYRNMLKYPEAIESFRKALELAPTDPHGYYQLAATYARARNRERMMEYLRRAVSENGQECKDEALNDPSFQEYWNDPEFRDVTES